MWWPYARVEEDGSVTKPSRLALDSRQPLPVVNDQVVPRVFAEGDQHRVSRIAQRKHHRERRAISFVFRMVHDASLPDLSAGPCPNQTT
jgi:hypothetical protein